MEGGRCGGRGGGREVWRERWREVWRSHLFKDGQLAVFPLLLLLAEVGEGVQFLLVGVLVPGTTYLEKKKKTITLTQCVLMGSVFLF